MNELAALKRRMRWTEQLASCGSTRPAALRPDVAARFGITNEDAAALPADEARLERGVDAEEKADVDEGQLRAAK